MGRDMAFDTHPFYPPFWRKVTAVHVVHLWFFLTCYKVTFTFTFTFTFTSYKLLDIPPQHGRKFVRRCLQLVTLRQLILSSTTFFTKLPYLVSLRGFQRIMTNVSVPARRLNRTNLVIIADASKQLWTWIRRQYILSKSRLINCRSIWFGCLW